MHACHLDLDFSGQPSHHLQEVAQPIRDTVLSLPRRPLTSPLSEGLDAASNRGAETALASHLSASARDESSSDKSARNYAKRASAINDGMGRNVDAGTCAQCGNSYEEVEWFRQTRKSMWHRDARTNSCTQVSATPASTDRHKRSKRQTPGTAIVPEHIDLPSVVQNEDMVVSITAGDVPPCKRSKGTCRKQKRQLSCNFKQELLSRSHAHFLCINARTCIRPLSSRQTNSTQLGCGSKAPQASRACCPRSSIWRVQYDAVSSINPKPAVRG